MAISEQIQVNVHPAEHLEERLVNFAVHVLNLCTSISVNFAGKHIASQLVRSGTSPAPNYAEARSAESRADFIHKLRVVVKELNESLIWLKILAGSQLVPAPQLRDLQMECIELKRIIGASLRTARLNVMRSKRRPEMANNQ